MRRWTVLKTVGFVFVLTAGSLWIVWLVRHSDAVLARWASIATIIGLPVLVYSLLPRSASKPVDETGIRAKIGMEGPVIVGYIPQESRAFDKRIELFKVLTKSSSNLQIYTVAGRRGAGKSQLAGAVARKRIAQRWRVIAWLNAENEADLLTDLCQLAIRLGLNRDYLSSKELAISVRHWLEADGDRCLLILDSADSGDLIRQYLPAAGRAQIIITADNQELDGIGIPISMAGFTPSQAITYMQSRTGLTSGDDAADLVADLDHLPLALAQAASVIAEQRLDYATYRQRLKTIRVSDYVVVAESDPYPLGTAEAIMLSVSAAEKYHAGTCREILELLAIFSSSGVPRAFLYSVAGFMQSKGSPGSCPHLAMNPVDVDAVLQALTKFSLLTWDLEGASVSLPRLVARVILERAEREETLSALAWHMTDFLAKAFRGELEEVNKARPFTSDVLWVQGFACVQSLAPFHESLDDLTIVALFNLISLKLTYDSAYARGRASFLTELGRFDEAVEVLEKALVNLDEEVSVINDSVLRLKASMQKLRLMSVRHVGIATGLIVDGLDKSRDLVQGSFELISEALALADDVDRVLSKQLIENAKTEIYADLEHIRNGSYVQPERGLKPLWRYRLWRYRRNGRHSAKLLGQNLAAALSPAINDSYLINSAARCWHASARHAAPLGAMASVASRRSIVESSKT